jgi:hypothetical protein
MHFRQVRDEAGQTVYLAEGRRACYLVARTAATSSVRRGERAWALSVHPADAELLIDAERVDGAMAASKALLLAAARVYEELAVERAAAVWAS